MDCTVERDPLLRDPMRLRLAVLLATAIVAPSFAEESDATSAPCAAPELYTGKVIVGYTPASNVVEHAKIDQDMKSMQKNMAQCTKDGWAAARKVYEEGEASKKSDGKRTIKGFSMKAGEPIGDIYIAYKAKHDPHKLVEAALAGTDSNTAGYEGKFGTTATGAAPGAVAGAVCHPPLCDHCASPVAGCPHMTSNLHGAVLR